MNSRVKELNGILSTKVEELRDFAKKGIVIEDGNVSVSGEDGVKAKKLYAEITEIKSALDIELCGTETKSYLDKTDASVSMAANAMIRNDLGANSVGEAFVKSPQFVEMKDAGLLSMQRPFEVEIFDLASHRQVKDVYTAMNPTTLDIGVGSAVQFDPMVPRAQRRYRVRDLFPVAATSNNMIEYYRVMGFTTNDGMGAAAPVAERSGETWASTNQSQIRYEPDEAKVRTISHFEVIHRNTIADVPQLMSTVNNELLYGLALAEDAQLVNGDGTGENLVGVCQTNGIQIFTAESDEIRTDSLRRAATLSSIANYPATGYVLHPFDWERCELQKGSDGDGGDGQYMLVTNVAIGAQTQVWRQPVIETPAMTEGQFLTGAFGIGAQLYDRQKASIRTSEHHANLFIQSAVAVLAEQRVALAVKRPEAFVLGTFDT